LTIRIWFALALLLSVAGVGLAQDVSLIRDIEVRGSVNVNKETILAAMRTKVGQPYVQAQLDQDKRSIEDMGFFQAVDVRARETGDGAWTVVVEVVEFPRIKEIRVVGNTVIPTADILKAMSGAAGLPIAVGNVYNLKSVSPASRAVEDLYTNRGYFARVSEFGPLPDSPGTVSITIIELTVNSVAVQGATRTKKYVLDRLIKTRPGEVLHIPSWQADLRRLWGTQWFESVDSIQNPTEEPGRVDLIADVKEARTGVFNVGLQVDPRNTVAGLLSLRDTNFRGTGQTIGVGILQGSGGGGTSVDLDYGNPFMDKRDTSLNVSLYSRVIYRFSGIGFGGSDNPTRDDQFTERRTGLSVSVGRPFRRTGYASVGLKFENIKTGDLDTDQKTGFIQQDGDVAILAVGLANDRRDVTLDPSRGDYMRLLIEPGYSNIREIGGDAPDPGIIGPNTFVRSLAEYRTYWSPQPPRGLKLDESRRVFAIRVRYGYIAGDVPFFEQFFVGGSDSLRGFPEDRFWGTQMAVATFEYRHPVQKAFNVIAFADYGSAWGGYGSVNRYTQSGGPDFRLGYGVGFSFRTPLGPIRLDFGFNDKGGSRTHFVIGTSF
jgi:outer membrane protein insertion porin family